MALASNEPRLHYFHPPNLKSFISQIHISLRAENWIALLLNAQPLAPKGLTTGPQPTFPGLSLHSWNAIQVPGLHPFP